MRKQIPCNNGWEYTERWDDSFPAGESYPVTLVDLPHTCKETPYDYFDESLYQMVCGYRKTILVPDDWAGKRVFLHVEAAGHFAEVYWNQKKLAEHRCGYTAFQVELTDVLTPGESGLLSLRVDTRESLDQPPFGNVVDYLTYGGLYREVWLEVREQSFLEDVFIKPKVDGRMESKITLSGSANGMEIRQKVFFEKNMVAEASFAPGADFCLTVPQPKLWDVDAPHLYQMVTELWDGGELLDRIHTTFGFRSAEWKKDGFYLNGRKLKIVGLNRHQSFPYIGYAAPASLQRFDAELLKYELGVNAVRTSHYPQSQHFIDRCDELGLLVFTEIPGWQHIGGDAWKRQAIENVREMVTQYRNHPSIILWGTRINESKDDEDFYLYTANLAKGLDPTRSTGGVRCHKRSQLLEDVYTYNDFVHDGNAPGCEPKKAVTSDLDRPYVITEYNGHMFPTKTFDSEEHRMEHALRHARVLDAVAAERDIAGSFGWCMFDYNTHKDFGSGDRICYHGVLDMFRNKKWAADVYAALGDEDPVLTVTSCFDIGERPTGNRGRIFVLTNADSVRMYKNGIFIREYTHLDSPFENLERGPIEIDDFVGESLKAEGFSPTQEKYVKDLLNYAARFGFNHLPPKIKAKTAALMTRYRMAFADAYALYGKYIGDWGAAATTYRFDAIKDGRVVKSVAKTPMTSLHLSAQSSALTLTESTTYDAALIRIAMTDQNGNVLPFYQGAVELKADGPLWIIGPTTAILRGGLGGTLVRTTGDAGKARLTLTAPDTEPVHLDFTISKTHLKEEVL